MESEYPSCGDRNFTTTENGSMKHTQIEGWRGYVCSIGTYAQFTEWLPPCYCSALIPLSWIAQRLHQGEVNMRRSQGRYFSSQEIDKIKYLLSTTDLTLQEIATRMSCAKSSIVTINQNFHIREYRGRRRYWDQPMSEEAVGATDRQTDTILPYSN